MGLVSGILGACSTMNGFDLGPKKLDPNGFKSMNGLPNGPDENIPPNGRVKKGSSNGSLPPKRSGIPPKLPNGSPKPKKGLPLPLPPCILFFKLSPLKNPNKFK
ncbi:hypothetical protein HanXRQr2_Chr07g0282601 [Helianthus annuus]|uniref:Uncharacterized protein n=1 Tax=Helianthus annuus TaxID=4232 RepID=A0A9K3IJB6_HELAN|nr:hypothetical protein HanXRQr2_Chr07g0282601 [Helianthus annuus]KAJ0903738.1 hypothetical protein HanPSC8_Chr07g0273401 [Helianthus annuus]